jgi:membrane protein DedA with SNARE-associated domain
MMAGIAAFFGGLVARYGVLGLAIGMFAESLGIPTASVVLELTAGPMIVAGKTTMLEAVIFATIGLTIGSVVSYYMGYFGVDLGKRIFQRGAETLQREQSGAKDFIQKYGDVGILFAQLFGPARTWISVPAGALRMDIKKFTFYTAVGGAIYCSFAIGVSVALTGTFRALYLHLQHQLNSPLGAGLIVALAVLSLLGSAYISLKILRRLRVKDDGA